MKKKYSLVPLLLCMTVLFSSCGKEGTDKLPDISFSPDPGISSSAKNDTTEENTSIPAEDKVNPENQETEESNVPEKKKENIKKTNETKKRKTKWKVRQKLLFAYGK